MQRHDRRRASAEVREVEGAREQDEQAKQRHPSLAAAAQFRRGEAEADDLCGFENADHQRVFEHPENVRPPVFVGAAVDADHLKGTGADELDRRPFVEQAARHFAFADPVADEQRGRAVQGDVTAVDPHRLRYTERGIGGPLPRRVEPQCQALIVERFEYSAECGREKNQHEEGCALTDPHADGENHHSDPDRVTAGGQDGLGEQIERVVNRSAGDHGSNLLAEARSAIAFSVSRPDGFGHSGQA